MYCELKKGVYWIWLSRKSSLHSLPQFKFETLEQLNDKILSLSEAKFNRLNITKAERKKARQRKVYEKSQQMRSERLYSWAANLN